MVDPEATAAILKRALDYPYAVPDRSYLYRDGQAHEPPGDGFDLGGRTPLISYGANSAPEALGRKLAALPGLEMPVVRAELEDFDVVYSAHVSPYGAIPGTLWRSPGTVAPVFVIHPTPEQRHLLTASEPNYDLVEVDGIAAYRSKHGCLQLDGSPVGVAAVAPANRSIPALTEREVQARVRDLLEPQVSLEAFVLAAIDPAVAAARTASLRSTANRAVFDRGMPE